MLDTLNGPDAIFQGLKRFGQDESLCYTSSPDKRWSADGVEEEVPMDEIFLVFVKPENGLIVFDWEFRRGAPGKLGHPLGWDTDFNECLWKKG